MVHPIDGGQVESTTKSKRWRSIALDPAALAALQLHRHRVERWAAAASVTVAPDGFVFSYAPDGREPMWLDRPTDYVIRLRRIVKIPGLRLHDLLGDAAQRGNVNLLLGRCTDLWWSRVDGPRFSHPYSDPHALSGLNTMAK